MIRLQYHCFKGSLLIKKNPKYTIKKGKNEDTEGKKQRVTRFITDS